MGSPTVHLGRVFSGQAANRGLSRFSRSENGTVPLWNLRITPYNVLRVILGLILLTAAALKGHQLATEPLAERGLLTSRWFLIGVVEFELFFGLWLCCGLYARRTWEAALLCFAAFACVSLYKALSGEATCGCFGRVPVSPWYTLILDLAAVAALMCFRPPRQKTISPLPPAGEGPGVRAFASPLPFPGEGPGVRARLRWVFGLFVAAGLPGGLAMATYRPAVLEDSGDIFGDSEFVVLEPEGWVGKPFPLLKHIDIGDRLARGRWIVVLYHHDCPNCQDAVLRYEHLAQELGHCPGVTRIALVEMFPYAPPGDRVSLAGSSCSLGRLSNTKKWSLLTPTMLRVSERRVLAVCNTAENWE